LGVLLLGIGAAALWYGFESLEREPEAQIRQGLFDALAPVTLSNCQLERFGEANDGGYLLCANLLGDVKVGYSYGISGYDGWGCEVSTRLGVAVHQYDCFDTRQPACPADTRFHAECIGPDRRIVDGRVFGSLDHHFLANGGTRAVVKMDVEGAEWDALMAAPDDVLDRIDQLAIEFHHVHERRFLDTVRRLKRFFHVVNVHYNNFSCRPGLEPFPAWAYEVLFVSRRIGRVGSSPTTPRVDLDAPNDATRPDCQFVLR
jgi:hypothetical protein